MKNFLDQSAKRFDEKFCQLDGEGGRILGDANRKHMLPFLRSEQIAAMLYVLEDVRGDKDIAFAVENHIAFLTALQDTPNETV